MMLVTEAKDILREECVRARLDASEYALRAFFGEMKMSAMIDMLQLTRDEFRETIREQIAKFQAGRGDA